MVLITYWKALGSYPFEEVLRGIAIGTGERLNLERDKMSEYVRPRKRRTIGMFEEKAS